MSLGRQRPFDCSSDVTQISRHLRRIDADPRNRHRVRTRVTLGAFADRELQSDGAVAGTYAAYALPEFRGQSGDKRVAVSAKSFRAGIPLTYRDAHGDR